MKCYVTYLRANDYSDPLFKNIKSVGDFAQCSGIISSFFDRLYDNFNSTQKFYDCMKTSLKHLKNEFLFTIATEVPAVGPEATRIQHDKGEAINSRLRVAQEACHETGAKEDTAAEFDKTVRGNKNKTISETEGYCIKKHLISLGILDSNGYNSDTDVGSCDSLISTLQENSYREMQKHTSNCLVDSYRKNYLIEQYMKVEYLVAQMNLTSVEMAFKRDNFVQAVSTIKEKARKACNTPDLNIISFYDRGFRGI